MSNKTEKIKNWGCPRPFDHIYSDANGDYKACCIGGVNASGNWPNIHNTSPMDWLLNSKELKDLRQEMVQGKIGPASKKQCFRCIEQEEKYGHSDRIHHLKSDRNVWKGIYKNYTENEELNLSKRSLILQVRAFGNQCNLDCYMCQPQASSIRQDMNRKLRFDKYISFDNPFEERTNDTPTRFIDQLLELEPYIETVFIQGGEPLIMKQQYQFLDKLIELGNAKYISLEMSTNLTVLGDTKHNILDYIPKFKRLLINISLDGFGKYNNYIRRRSNWDIIIKNYNLLKTFPNVRINIFSTVSLLSVLHLDQLSDWCAEEDLRQTIFIVDDPEELHPRHLPDRLKESLLKKYKNNNVILSALKMEGDKEKFKKSIEYIKATDQYYQTNIYEIFPELEDYK